MESPMFPVFASKGKCPVCGGYKWHTFFYSPHSRQLEPCAMSADNSYELVVDLLNEKTGSFVGLVDICYKCGVSVCY